MKGKCSGMRKGRGNERKGIGIKMKMKEDEGMGSRHDLGAGLFNGTVQLKMPLFNYCPLLHIQGQVMEYF